MGSDAWTGSAVISDCGKYRYRLERERSGAGKVAAGIMVNPSVADWTVNDHTIRKWFGLSERNEIRKFIIGNKFGFRATDIKELRRCLDPVGPENDRHLEQIMRDADIHIVAWGPLSKLPRDLRSRWEHVVRIAQLVGCPLYCWGTAKDGHPRHPLMISYNTQLIQWKFPP